MDKKKVVVCPPPVGPPHIPVSVPPPAGRADRGDKKGIVAEALLVEAYHRAATAEVAHASAIREWIAVRDAGRWIPVGERLPEPGNFLVRHRSGAVLPPEEPGRRSFHAFDSAACRGEVEAARGD